MFHKSCLAATKINQAEPKCPMCRSNYKERISKRGIKQARNYAARKIQSLVKSFLVRRRLFRNSDLPAPSFLQGIFLTFIKVHFICEINIGSVFSDLQRLFPTRTTLKDIAEDQAP